MAVFQWKTTVGQERLRDLFDSAYEKGTLGHAYLLCGDTGSGTFAVALDLALGLLCENEQEKGCAGCVSCSKILHYAHPDFHCLTPISLQKEHRGSDGKLNADGWAFLSECILNRIKEPLLQPRFTGLPSIPVEWVREINHAILRGSTGGNRRNVAIMEGIDLMNAESANAMLKTLEEPPAGTVMLLTTDRIHAVLPTIVSRCQLVRLSSHTPEVIRDELVRRFGVSSDDPRVKIAMGEENLGMAIGYFNEPDDEAADEAVKFWNNCIRKDWEKVIEGVDELGGRDDKVFFEKFFLKMARQARNAFLKVNGYTEYYFSDDNASRFELEGMKSPARFDAVLGLCQNAVVSVRAYGNISLILAHFAFSVMELINGKKQ